ncbi:MAG: ISAs1 family transposase [Pikeienuella sp.]
MSMNFLDHIDDIEDPRVPGMVFYPLDEILLCVLVGLLCRGEDFDEIEDICGELLDWLRLFAPFARGIAPAQTLKRTLARLDPKRLEEAFAGWSAALAGRVRGVVAIDGKTLRGSKQDATGKGALHLVSAWAHEAGLVLAQCAVDGKSNEITAIPELLDLLALKGAIVTIDAMGTQKAIAGEIIARKADYVLALKANQGTLEADAALFFDDPELAAACLGHEETSLGHGRIEERTIRVADAAWLAERHPEWKGLASIAAVTARRSIKRTGETSTETRLFISSLPPDPARLAHAVRAHWSIENNLHWSLDVAFHEDDCRTRQGHAARNLASIRRAVLNMLRRDPSRISIKRKRLKALINPEYRAGILTVNNS